MNSGETAPRVVVVRRSTEYEELLAAHGTRGQAEFFLKTRGQDIGPVFDRHESLMQALGTVLGMIPQPWRRASVLRSDLDRFAFARDDIVVLVGQDGLVANVAKYLNGQPVIGVNPDPSFYEGALVRHTAASMGEVLRETAAVNVRMEERTMVRATLDNGRYLTALNEIFVGHRTHQSARYHLHYGHAEEEQSSSGVIVSSGTGSTGWARSIWSQRQTDLALPQPTERRLVFFAREAWPSRSTQTGLIEGNINDDNPVVVTSHMGSGGVIFGDGIEVDAIEFDWGLTATLTIADAALHMVLP